MLRHDRIIKPNSPLKMLEKINVIVRLSVNTDLFSSRNCEKIINIYVVSKNSHLF